MTQFPPDVLFVETKRARQSTGGTSCDVSLVVDMADSPERCRSMATAAVELRLAKRQFKYDSKTAAPKPQPVAEPRMKSHLDPTFPLKVRFWGDV